MRNQNWAKKVLSISLGCALCLPVGILNANALSGQSSFNSLSASKFCPTILQFNK